jgi:hypothetical protein
MPPHRLQRRRARRFRIAVIDGEGGTAVLGDTLCQRRRNRNCSGADLGDVALRAGLPAGKQRGRGGRRGRRREDELVGVDGHDIFPPSVDGPDELMYRQRIEKFVGDDDQRAVWNAGKIVMPGRVVIVERDGLHVPQDRTRLDQMNRCSRGEIRQHPGCAQGVLHQCPTPRAEFDQVEGGGASHEPPHFGAP